MKKEKTITVRRQKIQPDRTKKRLCFFLFLTALLLLTVVFAEQICPYDPMHRIQGLRYCRRERDILPEQIGSGGICCPEFWWV